MSLPRRPVYMAIEMTALSRSVRLELSFSNVEAIIAVSASDRIAKFFRTFFYGGIISQRYSHSFWQSSPLEERSTLIILF